MKKPAGLTVTSVLVLALMIVTLNFTVFPAKSADSPTDRLRNPTPPAGWTMEETETGWSLASPNPSGKGGYVVISKEHKAVGRLEDSFDQLWDSTVGTPPSVSRTGQKIHGKVGDWETIGQGGIISPGRGTFVYLAFMVLQQGDRQFSVKVLTELQDQLATYGAGADQAIRSMMGTVEPVRATKGQFTFKGTFPPQWQRQDGPGFLEAARMNQFGQVDRVISMSADAPIQDSLDQTFEKIWNLAVARLGMRMDNPGLLSPERPQPLKRRLNNGLAVWFEGGVGKLPQLGDCYLQIYMIPAEKTVSTVAVIYVLGMEQTSSADRAPIWAFLESLHSDEPISKRPLFSNSDCVGTWRMTLTTSLAGFYSASGAYLGDASSGGIDDLTLRPDGTYSRLFAGKGPYTAFSWQEQGTWSVDDTILTLTPTSSSDQAHAKPQKHRLYGRAIFSGSANLIVGAVDDRRLPTDAREAGALVEVASRGGALLRYEAK
jgi:hypothetical protein